MLIKGPETASIAEELHTQIQANLATLGSPDGMSQAALSLCVEMLYNINLEKTS